MFAKAEKYQLVAALSALLAGLVVYLLARPAESVYLFSVFSVSSVFYGQGQHLALLGKVGQWLPSAIHAYAFILLTVLAVGNGPRVLFASSLFWVAVGWLFEWGQYPAVSAQLLARLPEWFAELSVLENIRDYFQYGTFDSLDLVATLVGALGAWVTYQLTTMKRTDVS